jgi:PhnB protein
MAVKPIPEGYPTVVPYLVVDGAEGLIEFATKAFGAKERMRMPGPGGAIGHAELEIGDSLVMLSDASTADNNRTFTAMLHLYVEDCDAAYQAALDAGGKTEREPATQFYGDRSAAVWDAYGNLWFMSTHVEDVPPEEMEKRSREWMEQQQAQG